MKTREQNRNNNLTGIERFDWFIERTQTRAAFGWLSEHSGEKTSCPWSFYEGIDTSLWRHTATRLANQCFLHIRVFFGGKSKSPCFDLFIHWLIKQVTNTYGNHFSRSYKNRSIQCTCKSWTLQSTMVPVIFSHSLANLSVKVIQKMIYKDDF